MEVSFGTSRISNDKWFCSFKKTCSSFVRTFWFFIDLLAYWFYICALTLSCGSPKSFNVVLLDCNELLLSAMRCSWKTRFSVQTPAGRLCVFSFVTVRSLLLVSIELQRKIKHPIFDKSTSRNGQQLLRGNSSGTAREASGFIAMVYIFYRVISTVYKNVRKSTSFCLKPTSSSELSP